MMDEITREILRAFADEHATPAYVYFPQRVVKVISDLSNSFGDRFTPSFAMKCNPNIGLLRAMRGALDHVDASSIGEVERGLAAGYGADNISFSGPAKRDFEIKRAVELGIGAIVCESEEQIKTTNSAARELGKRAQVLLRVNPVNVPKSFGLSMGGRASQFGIDEEDFDRVMKGIEQLLHIDVQGFHVFSGGNSLSCDSIAENFAIMVEIFERLSQRYDLEPKKLVFGAGFGIPYFAADEPLNLEVLCAAINPLIDKMREIPRLSQAKCMLEMGRFLVGSNGYLLTRVVASKLSRGTQIRMCDAGFNNHLSACGMMGTVIRRNWRFVNLNNDGQKIAEYLLVGPLCASFDQLAAKIELPEVSVGDCIAVASSGAYGLTASPTRFISHPEPREYLAYESTEAKFEDVTESQLNHAEYNLAVDRTAEVV